MRKSVLVVDDEKKLLSVILELLKLEGFDAVGAETGLVGYEKAVICKPNLIISDIRLPDISGYEFLKKVRATYETAHTPFIFLSAQIDKERVQSLQQDGYPPVKYLSKPFNVDEVINAIRSYESS